MYDSYEEIIEATKDISSVIEPGQCNIVSSHIGGFISHFEEELAVANDAVSTRWAQLRGEVTSDTKADRGIELTDEYRHQQTIKRRIGILKRLRADLRDRFQVLTNTKRY